MIDTLTEKSIFNGLFPKRVFEAHIKAKLQISVNLLSQRGKDGQSNFTIYIYIFLFLGGGGVACNQLE